MAHLKKCFFRTSICILTFYILLLVYRFPKRNISSEICNITEIADASITPLKDNITFVLNAYYDNRERNIVRIIAIVHYHNVKKLFCWFHCTTYPRHTFITSAEIDFHSDRFGFPYGTADLVCSMPEDCKPKYLSVHWSLEGKIDQLPVFEIKNLRQVPLDANFSICMSALYGSYSNALQLIQTIEMYKLLGAQKVMIYTLHHNCCSEAVEEVLQHYIKERTLEVIRWPIDLYFHVSQRWKHSSSGATNIGYYGQVAALNDCLYRNMYRTRFLLLNDIDEIILPFKHKDWHSMMEVLQEQYPSAATFLFENHVFPITVLDSTVSMPSWDKIPGVNMLQCVYRKPKAENSRNHKMLIIARKVTRVSIHTVLIASGGSHLVSSDIAILRHCKKTPQPLRPEEQLIRDTTIWRYKEPLTQNVNKTIDIITKLIKDKVMVSVLIPEEYSSQLKQYKGPDLELSKRVTLSQR